MASLLYIYPKMYFASPYKTHFFKYAIILSKESCHMQIPAKSGHSEYLAHISFNSSYKFMILR